MVNSFLFNWSLSNKYHQHIPFTKQESDTHVNKYQLIQASNEVQNPNHRNIKKRQVMYV